MQTDVNGIKVTWDRFYHDIKEFLLRLMERPMEAQVSPYLSIIGMDKQRVVKYLVRNGVLQRVEGIVDDGIANPTYSVKYIVKGKNFERKLHRMFTKYFEKNLPEPIVDNSTQTLNEDEGGGDLGGASSCDSVGGQYTPRPDQLFKGQNKETIIRRALFTESQWKYIQEATGMSNIGSVGDYTANGLVLKTSDGKRDPSYDR